MLLLSLSLLNVILLLAELLNLSVKLGLQLTDLLRLGLGVLAELLQLLLVLLPQLADLLRLGSNFIVQLLQLCAMLLLRIL